MTPERWQQITELLDAALEREPVERPDFLRDFCAGDEELRQEVELLLAEHDRAGSYIDKPLVGSVVSLLNQAVPELNGNALVDGRMIGQSVGHYQIIDKLGEGGMGVVYKGRDSRLERFVAIKMLRLGKIADDERKQRFLQEAKSASALNHPNIITIHDTDRENEIDFIVMEYVAGKTLDQLIPPTGLELNEALRYALQVAEALVTAHAAGIVHRDLKPSNVMVSESGLVKVLDFGLAKLAEQADRGVSYPVPFPGTNGGPHTQEGLILGTDAYMSPEQAEGKKTDTRSDIFSFGAVLYEMVTGQKAFQGDSKTSKRLAILKKDPKPISEISTKVPPDLEKIIDRCLEKSPDARWQSMKELKNAVQALKEAIEAGNRTRLKFADWMTWRSWLWAGVAIVLLTSATAMLLFHDRSRKPAAPPEEVPLTSYVGKEQSPSISPDGNQVAFCWDGEKQDNQDIYVKSIGSQTALRLTADPADDVSPAYSPDGRSIGFFRMAKQHMTFIIIPSGGGPERVVTEVPVPYGLVDWDWPLFAWFPDGKWVVTDGLALLSTETGEIRPLTSPHRNMFTDGAPAISPDGHTIAFSRSFSWFDWDIYILDLTDDLKAKGEPRQLTFLEGISSSPVWTANGHEIVFNEYNSGALYKVALSGSRVPEQLPFGRGDASSPAISLNGNRLVYQQNVYDFNLWRLALSGSGVAAGPPVRFIASTRRDWTPQYSPDGKHIVFFSGRSGGSGIWVSDAERENAVLLFSQAGKFVGSPSWSPDGQQVAFDSNLEGNMDIYVIAASGGRPRQLTMDSKDDNVPSWSRDGKWIYFTSIRSGGYEVWKAPSGGGEAIQVTRNGGFAAFESPNGEFVYFTKGINESSMALWRMPVSGGVESQILPSVVYRAFAIVDNGIYFIPEPGADGKYSIQFLDQTTGITSTVAKIPGIPDRGLTISPDLRYLLYCQQDQVTSDLILVENFR